MNPRSCGADNDTGWLLTIGRLRLIRCTSIAIHSNWSASAHVTAGVKKDVIVLQPYQTAEVDFVPRQAGLALFHCHQQMHMEMGFKRLFRIVV